ncbi:MAG: HPr family phosphocarrier protein [Rhodobacteraceae bacterium]|nr:HPr family phosphocarrier protein [Paracoccaceae bacterium]
MEVIRKLRIVNEKGLHARASAKFVETVEQFQSEVQVVKDELSAAGDSIMGLLMLAASKGSEIEVRINGSDAEQVADALEELLAQRFGEKF